MRRSYLDYNAMAPFRKEQLSLLQDFLDLSFGNPSALHYEGRLARQKIETSRQEIADCFDVKADQIVFTSGATEANNWVVGHTHEQRRFFTRSKTGCLSSLGNNLIN
jgi:cysteine desulfurase